MQSLSQSELRRLLSSCPRRHLRCGTVREADDFGAASLLIVERGIVAIAGGGPKRKIVLSFCSPGALLPPPRGDEQLLGLLDSAVIAVPADVERTLLQIPAAAQLIVDALLEELRERQQSLAQFGNVTHAERLRAKLLQLAGSHGTAVEGGVELELPLTHKLLAEAIGSARETVTTAVRSLEREGFLKRDGRRYRVTISSGDGGSATPSPRPHCP
jgi:DNA-binding MarR family transcriptional regulator